jgi:Fur family zinc uptake transcriptional regulator
LVERQTQAKFSNDPFPRPGHNHAACSRIAMEVASAICERNNVRFTDMRRAVLSAIWRKHKPITAYDLLAVMNSQGGKRHAPIAVYRALDFLLSQGLIHRISSLNAFIGCSVPDEGHDASFLICRGCQTIAEIDDEALNAALRGIAVPASFQIEHRTVEISGLCNRCRKLPRADVQPGHAS